MLLFSYIFLACFLVSLLSDFLSLFLSLSPFLSPFPPYFSLSLFFFHHPFHSCLAFLVFLYSCFFIHSGVKNSENFCELKTNLYRDSPSDVFPAGKCSNAGKVENAKVVNLLLSLFSSLIHGAFCLGSHYSEMTIVIVA